MAKKQVAVTLRKPPSVDVDRFVTHGANDSRMTAVGASPGAGDDTVTRPDGRVLRELTVYLPAELARKLSLECMDRDRDLSNVMAEIVNEHLTRTPSATAPAAAPVTSAIEMAHQVLTSLWNRIPRFV
jgi:hypothetical protein